MEKKGAAMSYSLLDSGNGEKLERFGPYLLVRPAAQAVWQPRLAKEAWREADARFVRESGNRWSARTELPKSWITTCEEIRFKIVPTDFGHLGLFPEHALIWKQMRALLKRRQGTPNVLNLFAYSGGATFAAAAAGAKVCHLDASKGMVSWARENAVLNRLDTAPIRWIVDDVLKFLRRELKREMRYDGIILDPPSFGRGNQGEVFKIERDLPEILELCKKLLSNSALFVFLSSHTPGFTPLVMHHLLTETLPAGRIEAQEMVIRAENSFELPCGSYAKWVSHET
jgi:23S rRNA (cytosine1962-C5)-methyltransferase